MKAFTHFDRVLRREARQQEAHISLKVTIGGSFPRGLMNELEGIAKALGEPPGSLAAGFIKEGLATARAKGGATK